jgi:flagella basal body P-ring formation protein FlgA
MTPLILLAAVAFQPTPTLDRAVAAFTGHAIGEEGGARMAIDARLRLASCPTVALSWRSDAHDAVVVACSGPDWRVFVPVRQSTPVAAVAGKPLPSIAAKADPVIRRGDPVLIEAGNNGFSITREGIAAADAAPGARVAVRVDGALQPVQAVAVATGRVTLPGWGN